MNIKLKAAIEVLAVIFIGVASGSGVAIALDKFGFDVVADALCISALVYLTYLFYQHRVEELKYKEQFKKLN